MKKIKSILSDSSTNNMIVAFIIAFSTVNFLYTVGSMLITPLLVSGGHPGPKFEWDFFASWVIIYLATLLVAFILSLFNKGNVSSK